MQRINVVGTSGSGKSTFARQLAEVLNAKYIEMDALFWGPDWTGAEDAVFFNRLERELDASSWVLDGNYSRTLPIKWRRADTVIWIDYGFTRTLYQSLRRAVRRLCSQQEIWPGTGNRESFRRTFLSRDSILLWTLTNYAKNKRKYSSYMAADEYAELRFIRLGSPRQSRAFINRLLSSADQQHSLSK